MARANADGFSLVEFLIATLIVTTAVSSLAHLFVLATRATAGAREMTMATMVAGQKIEQLKNETAASTPAVGGSIESNVEGFCDFLDVRGQPVGAGESPSTGAFYVRRWLVEGPVSRPSGAFVLQVVVRRLAYAAAGSASDARQWGGAHFVAVRSPWETR